MRTLTIREAKRRLTSMKEEVVAQNRRLREVFAASGDRPVQDELDVVQSSEPLSVAVEVADRNDDALLKINAALQAIDEGRFGICTDCGGQIAGKRLLAYPLVDRCLACQERIEDESPAPRRWAVA